METGKWSGGLAGLILCCAMAGGAHAQEDRVVYHVNDAANATAAIRNINNHLEVNPKVKIVVVTHAMGVDFLMEGKK